MKTITKVKSALDTEVKTMHKLLQLLSVEERIDYVKEMIPCLLSLPQQITSSSQRLADKHTTPFNILSQAQRDLIADVSEKTERLYNIMSEEN